MFINVIDGEMNVIKLQQVTNLAQKRNFVLVLIRQVLRLICLP